MKHRYNVNRLCLDFNEFRNKEANSVSVHCPWYYLSLTINKDGRIKVLHEMTLLFTET